MPPRPTRLRRPAGAPTKRAPSFQSNETQVHLIPQSFLLSDTEEAYILTNSASLTTESRAKNSCHGVQALGSSPGA
jgi:hypothetical protein